MAAQKLALVLVLVQQLGDIHVEIVRQAQAHATGLDAGSGIRRQSPRGTLRGICLVIGLSGHRSRTAVAGVKTIGTARRRLAAITADSWGKVDGAAPQAESGRRTVRLLEVLRAEQISITKRRLVCLCRFEGRCPCARSWRRV